MNTGIINCYPGPIFSYVKETRRDSLCLRNILEFRSYVNLNFCVGHVAILEWLLHHSLASGVEQDDYGATPIHDAAEQGQLKCLHVFYSHSVDLNYRDCDGLTPL